MKLLQKLCALLTFACAVSTGALCHADFHFWDIKEIYTNATGTVQFIELFTGFGGQNNLINHTITANSDGNIVTFTFDGGIAGSTVNKHLLIATANFGSIPGAVAQNYSTVPLPSNFFNPNATSVTFNFGHGTDIVTLAGTAIPKDGVNSLSEANPSSSLQNFVSGINSPTNFAGASGSVNLPPPASLLGDFNGDSVVDGADLIVWRNNFGATGAPTTMQGNADADGDVDGHDFLIWQRQVGATPVTAIPEPSTAALTLVVATIAACGLARQRRKSSGEPEA